MLRRFAPVLVSVGVVAFLGCEITVDLGGSIAPSSTSSAGGSGAGGSGGSASGGGGQGGSGAQGGGGSAACPPSPIHAASVGFGGSKYEDLFGAAVDHQGNVVVVGHSLSLDFKYPGGDTLPGDGQYELLLAKLAPDASLLWGKLLGQTGACNTTPEHRGNAVSVDANDDIFVTGHYECAIDFGGGTCPPAVLPASGAPVADYDAFLTKLDPNGCVVWEKGFGKPVLPSQGLGLHTDPNGDVVVVGRFLGALDFGNGISFAAQADMATQHFMVKVDKDGSAVWGHSWVGVCNNPGNTSCNVIDVDDEGSVYHTGFLSTSNGPIDLGGGVVDCQCAENNFALKMDTDGNHVWSRCVGVCANGVIANQSIMPLGVAVGPDHSVVYTGWYTADVDFGTGTIPLQGTRNGFVVKVDADGNTVWVRTFANTRQDEGQSVAFDANGDLWVTGVFRGTLDLDDGCTLVQVDESNPVDDAFVMHLRSSDGRVLEAGRYGNGFAQSPQSINVSPDGSVFLTGGYKGVMTYGGDTLLNAGDVDISVARFTSGLP